MLILLAEDSQCFLLWIGECWCLSVKRRARCRPFGFAENFG